MVRTPSFHCRGVQSLSQKTKILEASRCGQKKKLLEHAIYLLTDSLWLFTAQKKEERISLVRLFATPRTIACQAPLSVELSGVGCHLFIIYCHLLLLEWVAIPFSRGSSQPRDWTQFPCIAGRFFTVTKDTKGAMQISFSGNLSSPAFFLFGCPMRLPRILVPGRRIESGPSQWKHRVLTTAPPGKFLEEHF